jgi:hypothetical protein
MRRIVRSLMPTSRATLAAEGSPERSAGQSKKPRCARASGGASCRKVTRAGRTRNPASRRPKFRNWASPDSLEMRVPSVSGCVELHSTAISSFDPRRLTVAISVSSAK